MRQIMKLSWRQLGAQKILSYSLFLVATATCITAIILSGLAKDKRLASLLPATAAALPANIQYGLVFYNFEILFLRAGTLLVEGFLAYYLIVDAWKNHNLMHWATYPLTRTQLYFGLFSAILLLAGVPLVIIHSLAAGMLVSWLFIWASPAPLGIAGLSLQLLTDGFFLLVGLLSSVLAFWKYQLSYVMVSALLLCVILCNASVYTQRVYPGGLWSVLSILLLVTLLGVAGSLKHFTKQDL